MPRYSEDDLIFHRYRPRNRSEEMADRDHTTAPARAAYGLWQQSLSRGYDEEYRNVDLWTNPQHDWYGLAHRRRVSDDGLLRRLDIDRNRVASEDYACPPDDRRRHEYFRGSQLRHSD
jgi:hypothetical protein